ncbi:MAG: NADPH-dependent oxidoreductase [Paludibacteraceae bacterium]|nr:NADPH-dependent oxidoreductase [Paludibacteraceae bacterium]
MTEDLLKRRSIRKFKENDVPDTLLNELFTAAFQSSTTGNMQLYSVIVTRDKRKKEELAPAHFNQPAYANAPIILTFCADFNRFTRWCEQRNATPGYGNAESLICAILDTTIAAQTFCVAAERKGLGICYLGTTTYNPKEIAKVLNLPKLVVPIVTLSVGYPDENPPVSDRLPIDGIVHYETYKDYTPERIDEIFQGKEALQENKKFVKENGKENLAQVFTDVRYSKKDMEFFSQKLRDFIREQEFR